MTPRTTGGVAARASEEALQRGNSAPGGLALYIRGSFHGANPLTQHRWARAASPLRPTVRDWSSKIPNLVVSPQGAFSFYRLSALTPMPTARHKMLSCRMSRLRVRTHRGRALGVARSCSLAVYTIRRNRRNQNAKMPPVSHGARCSTAWRTRRTILKQSKPPKAPKRGINDLKPRSDLNDAENGPQHLQDYPQETQ
jgi:hypothetical protein